MTALASIAPERKSFFVDVPFDAKETKKGDLELKGYASTWVEDRDGESVDPKAFDESLPAYMEKNPILLYQHSQDMPLGRIMRATVDSTGLAVSAFVPPPVPGEASWKFTAYQGMKRGILRTFSIGGFFTRSYQRDMNDPEDPGKIIITKVELFEISVVSIPSNPDSLFSAAVKSLTGAANGPVLTTRARNQMAQLIGMMKMADAELTSMTDSERTERFDELHRLYMRAGLVPPDRDAWETVASVNKTKASPGLKLAAALPPLLHTMGFVKAGRAISKGNEEKLREALSQIQEVLSALDLPVKEDEVDEEKTEEPKGRHDYRGGGSKCEVCGKPPSDSIHYGSNMVERADRSAPEGWTIQNTIMAGQPTNTKPDENVALKDLGLAIAALSGEIKGLKGQQPLIVQPAAPNIQVTMPEMSFGGPAISVGQPDIQYTPPDVNVNIDSPITNHPPDISVPTPQIHVETGGKRNVEFVRDENGKIVGAKEK